jgi:glycosyltransferase involved in cell wall biosynthesis
LKVLVVSQHFWPEPFRINEVCAELVSQGHEVTVLTGQPNYPEGRTYAGYRASRWGLQRHQDGFDIARVPLVPRASGGAVRLVLNYLSFIASATLFGPWVLRGRAIDVIFVYGTSPILQAQGAVWLSWVKRAPLVVWVQDLWPDSLAITGYVRNAQALAIVGRWVRAIYRRCDKLLVQSSAFVAPVTQLASETPVVVLENPGDRPGPFGSLPNELQLPSDRFCIVFAGNLGTVQALETVLDAAAQSDPTLLWVLVGSGARSDWLQAEVVRRGLVDRVRLPGRFEPRYMPALFAQAGALLVTLKRAPALSMVVPSKVQTYLAAGRPILASLDGEGARVLSDSGAGRVVPAENAQALAQAANELSRLPSSERDAMGIAGLRYFEENYELGRVVRKLIHELQTTRNGAQAT